MESVLTMTSKTIPPPVDIPQDRLSTAIDSTPEESQPAASFTLRVKPDRRRVQLHIPPQLDRRRKQ